MCVRACLCVGGWAVLFSFCACVSLRLRPSLSPGLGPGMETTVIANGRLNKKKPSYIALACENRQITASTKTTLVSQSLAGRDKPTRLPRDTHTEKIQNKRRACTTTTPSFCLFYSCSKNPVPHRRKKKNIPIDRCSLSLPSTSCWMGVGAEQNTSFCACVC
jgi:hypothetical protein